MMRIVRKSEVKIDGVLTQIERCRRGPFLTETVVRDGSRNRRVVLELHGTDMRLRFAKSKRVLAVIPYADLVRHAWMKRWKLAPAGVKL